MIEQGSMQWRLQRLGRITGSRLVDVLAKTKSGPSASRANYAAQLVTERLTGIIGEDDYINAAMLRGIELEPYARDAYCQKYGTLVEQVSFIEHPTIPMFGASPDGLIDDDGTLEIKCLGAAAHIDVILNGVPSKYIPQLYAAMIVSGRQWADFAAWHPAFPENLRLVVYRQTLDEKYAAEIVAEVIRFDAEVDAIVERLRAIGEEIEHGKT